MYVLGVDQWAYLGVERPGKTRELDYSCILMAGAPKMCSRKNQIKMSEATLRCAGRTAAGRQNAIFMAFGASKK